MRYLCCWLFVGLDCRYRTRLSSRLLLLADAATTKIEEARAQCCYKYGDAFFVVLELRLLIQYRRRPFLDSSTVIASARN